MDAPPVRYMTTSDGYRIAYTAVGDGLPLVLSPNFYSHQELYWTQKTRVTGWIQGLASRFRLIQYDGRGQGLSTRGLPANFAMSDMVRDLSELIDYLDLRQVSLMSEGGHCHVIARYSAENPERVLGLILLSTAISNSAWSRGYYETLARENWPAFIQAQAGPGTTEQIQQTRDRLDRCLTQEDWLRKVAVLLASDITDITPSLKMPTLVLYPREYQQLPPDEPNKLTSMLPDARLVFLDGWAWGDPDRGVAAIEDFIAEAKEARRANAIAARPPTASPAVPRRDRNGNLLDTSTPVERLSSREVEVLRLIARGLSNLQIAAELVISVRTVERHINHVYDKIDAHTKAQATAYALRNGIA